MEKNRINIFENQYKKSDKSPFYAGFATIGGTDYKVALWPAKNGNGYSGEIERKDEKSAFVKQMQDTSAAPAPNENSYGAVDDDMDAVPF